MANKLRMVFRNWAEYNPLLLTDSPVSGTVGNLIDYSKNKVFTTTSFGGGGTHTINLKLITRMPINSVILAGHDFPVGTNLAIHFYRNSDFTNLLHTSNLLTVSAEEAAGFVPDMKPDYTYWTETPIDEVFAIRIVLYTPTKNLEISRLIVGEYVEPTYTISYGYTLSWIETTEQFRIFGNTLRSTDGCCGIRKITLDLNTINEPDRDILQTNIRNVGLRRDFYISLFPEDTEVYKKLHHSGIFKFTKIPSTAEYNNTYYKSSYELEEL